MKKLLFLAVSVLTVCTAATFTGCHGAQGQNANTAAPRSYTAEEQEVEDVNPDERDCKDGDCERKKSDTAPENFRFTPHEPHIYRGGRHSDNENGNDEAAQLADDATDDGDDQTPDVKPVHPHKLRPHDKAPNPRPMPVHPRK